MRRRNLRDGGAGVLLVNDHVPQRARLRRLVGLPPKQNSTGGKNRLGKTSKMGQRDIRRLLIFGASAVVTWAARKGPPKGSWLARTMARKPRMVVVVALANKMARSNRALTTISSSARLRAHHASQSTFTLRHAG